MICDKRHAYAFVLATWSCGLVADAKLIEYSTKSTCLTLIHPQSVLRGIWDLCETPVPVPYIALASLCTVRERPTDDKNESSPLHCPLRRGLFDVIDPVPLRWLVTTPFYC